MAIPSSVQKVLDKWNVEFSLTESTAFTDNQSMGEAGRPPRSAIAQVIFLSDEQGTVQVIVPSDRLLDLNLIAHQLGRRFTAIRQDDLNRLKMQFGLDEFPALPQLTNLDSLIDKTLLDRDELFIQSGTDNHWLKLPREQFRALTANSIVGRFSSPLQFDILQQDSEMDLKDINQAVRQFTPLRIRQRLQDTLDLPPLPDTARRIIDLRIDENADTLELARAVETDPSMSAQVISWARSPYYGSRGNVVTVEDAVLRVLGFDLVMNLSLGLALGRALEVPREGPRGYQTFWAQAVVGATLAGKLAQLSKGKLDSGHAYLCGLLHNFGFLVLGHVFPPQFSLVNRHIEANPHINRMYIERHLLGVTREQIAATLMQQWHMPEELVVALKQQHNPLYEDEHVEYARLLYVVSRSLRIHGFGDGPREVIDDRLLAPLGLTKEAVEDATTDLLERMHELQELIRLMDSNHP